jgi:asparagine synthase (glutamine-hydrolysing)
MAGIAGIERLGAFSEVSEMLDIIKHRGSFRKVFEYEGTTMGVIWNGKEQDAQPDYFTSNGVRDIGAAGRYAATIADNGVFKFSRDRVGVAPLYAGRDNKGSLCFASEVKSLVPLTGEVQEVPPGYGMGTPDEDIEQEHSDQTDTSTDPVRFAENLSKVLDRTVTSSIRTDDTGSWLSGGLDSASVCALAARRVRGLKTFAAGLKGAPDLEYASETARHIGASHHEVIVTLDDMIKVLPDVIYHLESFDALLVRSSILNFIVAKKASDYVSEVFSGEGGDELFGGYDYLKQVPVKELQQELLRITGKLHNTALQRVDRSSSAHGTTALVAFTDPQVVKYAFSIPAEYKIVNGVVKWILRKAMEGLLPDHVLWRPKAKFWDGAGVRENIADIADKSISDSDFRAEKTLYNGWTLISKEELYYYRIFKEYFGSNTDLSWMGRSD